MWKVVHRNSIETEGNKTRNWLISKLLRTSLNLAFQSRKPERENGSPGKTETP